MTLPIYPPGMTDLVLRTRPRVDPSDVETNLLNEIALLEHQLEELRDENDMLQRENNFLNAELDRFEPPFKAVRLSAWEASAWEAFQPPLPGIEPSCCE